jgi:hypothetical protein
MRTYSISVYTMYVYTMHVYTMHVYTMYVYTMYVGPMGGCGIARQMGGRGWVSGEWPAYHSDG